MKTFAKLSAVLGLVAAFGITAYAQAPTASTPPIAPSTGAMSTKTSSTTVKGYTRKTKSGKMVTVKGYTRKPSAKMTKTTTVKGYTRTMKNGKTVAVKGYTRKATSTKKMTAPKM